MILRRLASVLPRQSVRAAICLSIISDGFIDGTRDTEGVLYLRKISRYFSARSLAHRFLHERGNPCLFGGGQPLQREGARPHDALVEVRLVAETQRRVPRFELLRWLEEEDNIAVLGIRGHPVPKSRGEAWRTAFDDSVESLAHGAIRLDRKSTRLN